LKASRATSAGLDLSTLLIGVISDRPALAHDEDSLRLALIPLAGVTGLAAAAACLGAAILSRSSGDTDERPR